MVDAAPSISPKVSTSLPYRPPDPPPLPPGHLRADAMNVPLTGLNRGREKMRITWHANAEWFIALARSQDAGAMWRAFRMLIDPLRAPILVSLESVTEDFKQRLNPPPVPPPEFNMAVLRHAESFSNAIPPRTTDHTGGFFSSPFTLDEIYAAKVRAHKHPANSASGVDTTTYKLFISIKSDVLVELFNSCIDSLDAPHTWLTTILIPILKRGKDPLTSSGYRLVALESCLLKMLTLLIDTRVRKWCEQENIIPDSQNGFRPGFRTDNNVFVLRAAMERAWSEGKTLYVIFFDLTNAFPAVDLPSLWTMLYRRGVGGPLFDWIRDLYRKMAYEVRVNGMTSEAFLSLIGLLTGDTASPGFWNFLMSDLCMMKRFGDIFLNGRHIVNMEIADDVAIISTSIVSIAEHGKDFVAWSGAKGQSVSVPKSKLMVFGRVPHPLPTIRLAGDASPPLEWVDSHVYGGITLQSTRGCIFAAHYLSRATYAARVANISLAVQSFIGPIPPRDAITLYSARVDPHLTSGHQVIVDTNDTLLRRLEAVQLHYLRRVLHTGSRSMRAPLFSETGVMPLKYRRLILTIRSIISTASQPPRRLAVSALRDSIMLASRASPQPTSFVGDVVFMLRHLYTPITLLPQKLFDAPYMESILRGVLRSCHQEINDAIRDSDKTCLLHLRSPAQNIPQLRPYLLIVNPSFRIAFTQLLLSSHPLAIERGRWAPRDRPYVIPDHLRFCRFCTNGVEDETHAMFECTGRADLIELQRAFWSEMSRDFPAIHFEYRMVGPRTMLPRLMLHSDERVLQPVARLAYHVLRIFNSRPMFALSLVDVRRLST